jgi:rare lipoprotein A
MAIASTIDYCRKNMEILNGLNRSTKIANLKILVLPLLFCFACGRASSPLGYGSRSSGEFRNICGNRSCRGIYKIGKPYRVLGNTYYPREDRNYEEVGLASWYGDDFHSRKTANGDTFDMDSMTAAHRTLPMPSVLKVTNLENGRSALLVVNDRGPFVNGRIIDVSKKAAEELGFLKNGVAKVKVKFLRRETEKLLKNYGFR